MRRNPPPSGSATTALSGDGSGPEDEGRASVPDGDDGSWLLYRPTAAVIIWRRKYWIILIAIVVGAGTTYGARIPSPSYDSSAVIEVTMQQTSGAPNETLLAANELAAQYAELGTTSAVLTAAAAKLKVAPGDLAHSVSASTVSQLNLVKVSASGDSPGQSQQRANAAADALTANILKGNKRKVDAFMRKASSPSSSSTKQIAQLEREIAQVSKDLSDATTIGDRSRAQTVLQGKQATITALTTQQSGALSQLSVDAALGQPAVEVVSRAGRGSRSLPSPVVFGLIGTLAAAIVASQLFVLADSLRRAQRAVSSRERTVSR